MLKPLNDRVVIEVVQEEEVTAGGLVLTSAAKEKPQTGNVVAIGDGYMSNDGTKLPLSVKAGDKVLFEKYAGSEVKHEGKDYLIVHEKDIIAIVQ
ncbi:co-chaperone GroES [Vagococcus intermedius]|uniref:Co-chaperonin GroES n=1 Tax=Vagococcus intermedius TaxID=2991418 RepID=A0AAF0CVL8_9ENTE|nr:co-chaperone GroES [Vagococcus intermedius]WEG73691.1 co-chaperone GroES [Vagococcus intermedius]WEG75775.1 co-chaperone GroES [Vagococcus intermedius]